MFRIWGKIWKENHLIKDMIYEEEGSDTRTHKIMRGLEKICCEFDLPVPVWLDANIKDFQLHARTRFRQDHFMETIPFDYLEIQVIEED